MHDDKTQGEERLSPPAENKQMGAPLEKRPKPTPASPLRWKGVLLSILGIALPFASGFLIVWPWQYGDSPVILFIVLGVGLSVFVGAALLRSWWAITIVPAAFIKELANMVLVIGLVLLLAGFGAAIGVFYRGRLSNWLQQR